jgi:phosphoribosylanthranilate isomerase
MTKIKICGLFREEDINFANEAGSDFTGFVFAESRRQVSATQAARLRSHLRTDIVPVGVFVNAPAEEIAALYRDGIIAIAQLHGTEDAAYIRRLKTLSAAPGLPPVPVIKTLRVGGPPPTVQRHPRADTEPTEAVKRNRKEREGTAKDAKSDDCFADLAPSDKIHRILSWHPLRYSLHTGEADAAPCPAADYLLFDSGAGSGTPFDWALLNAPNHPPPATAASGPQKSATTANQCNPPLPWFLAGGISLENIDRALSLRPFGLDISSGAETDGFKDREKMIALVNQVRQKAVALAQTSGENKMGA